MDFTQDYASRLLKAINRYDPDDSSTVNQLRDLICWISDNDELKKDIFISSLLYMASQKMRVFGYNLLNKFDRDPSGIGSSLNELSNSAITSLYRSHVNSKNILDKTQKEVIDLFQSLPVHRLLVSAPTSYGKTFLMREIVFLNQNKYNNILLVFPTVALLVENAKLMSYFVKDNNLDYQVIKSVDAYVDDGQKKIFVFTPERALQLISSFPNLKIDFFFFDEIYKIDEDYCNNELDFSEPSVIHRTSGKFSRVPNDDFLNEDRGKTFRIALYLLSKSVSDYYLAGPNLGVEHFGKGLKRFLKKNNISVKEIQFEPTLRISVDAFHKKIEEKLPPSLPSRLSAKTDLVPISNHVNERITDVVEYINGKKYGKTLLYCTTPSKAIEYSTKLAESFGNVEVYSTFSNDFKDFIEHIRREYNVDGSVDEWSLIRVLKNGFGMHHGKLPKYIQHEILDQFNKGAFNVLFCTSTIVEGVNTDAQNMIILNPSKGSRRLTPFDIKNIKGRAGRYYHCFVGRVFYMSKELVEIENSDALALDFITYSDNQLGSIDLDNAEYEDLTHQNMTRKQLRDEEFSRHNLPEKIFIQNRTISKEAQVKLLDCLLDDSEFTMHSLLLNINTSDVERFLKYRCLKKILSTFKKAGLISSGTSLKFFAVANNYYESGFKGILQYEISQYSAGKVSSIDAAYSEAFISLRDILEHKIPKILSLFEVIFKYVAEQKGHKLDSFSLSHVRRYYETGVKSPIGEALIEYGFPTDAIRQIESRYPILLTKSVPDAIDFCRHHFRKQIESLLDPYENRLFISAMRSL